MKITLTLPDDVYEKLERDRGRVPRSTYIQDLIRGVSVGAESSDGSLGGQTGSHLNTGVGLLKEAFSKGESHDDSEPLYSAEVTDEIVENSLKAIKSGMAKRKGQKALPSQGEGEFKTYFKK